MLEHWNGEPLVRRAVRTFQEAGLYPVIVVISSDPGLQAGLDDLSVRTVLNPHPEQGISSSIAIGVSALPEENVAAVIGVADQPYVTADAIDTLTRVFASGHIVVPRYGDHRGNPAVFDRKFFAELRDLSGDHGGQRVIDAHPEAVTEVELPEVMGQDIDRPDQWPG